MPRFLIDVTQIRDGKVLLNEKETRHALSVLRLKPGKKVTLMDGRGALYTGQILSLKGKCLEMAVETDRRAGAEARGDDSGVRVTLGVAVIRPERMEILIQKACELGVHAVAPLLTERSVVRLSKERWAAKITRWRKIAEESCKQCGLAVVPEIETVQDFSEFVASRAQLFEAVLIPTLEGPRKPLAEILKCREARHFLVLIGPEGDFTPGEVQHALSSGALSVDLGPRVLRSETAGLYVLSCIQFCSQTI